MLSKRRFIAIALAVVMVLAMAFSALFVIHNAHHKCSGEDCDICQQINACLNLFDNKSPKPENALISCGVVYALVLVVGVLRFAENYKNLIDLKVKLSN